MENIHRLGYGFGVLGFGWRKMAGVRLIDAEALRRGEGVCFGVLLSPDYLTWRR